MRLLRYFRTSSPPLLLRQFHAIREITTTESRFLSYVAVAANERLNARLQRGDKNRTFSRLAVKASIFTNAFALGKRKKGTRHANLFRTTRKGKNVSVDLILRRKVPRNRNYYEDRTQFWPNNHLLNFLDYIIFESPLSGLSVDRPTSFIYAASLTRIVSFPVFLV